MWRWFAKRRSSGDVQAEVLRAAPLRPRIKTYSSDSGRVYQYVYRGWRPMPSLPEFSEGREFVFELTGLSEHESRVTVQLFEQELEDCRQLIGRELLDAEQYAIAKLSLFAAFDEVEDLAVLRRPIAPGALRMQQWLETLGRL